MSSLVPTASVTRITDPRPPAHRLLAGYPSQPGTQPTLPVDRGDSASVRVVSRIDPLERQAILALTQALMEAVQGRRRLTQLDRWAHPDVIATIGHLHRAGAGRQMSFRSARVQLVTAGIAEISVRLVVDGHSRAVGLRLVRGAAPGRWLCTRFETALWAPVITRAG